MYTIGIDLAITAAHKAIVAGADGKFVTPLLSFHTRWRDIEQLIADMRASIAEADRFIEEMQLSGGSIGSNDLTQLTLGLDRDSGLVAASFDERNPAVLHLIDLAITACKAQDKYVGICGQGPSDHPDLARWLLERGISSISLNPDTVVDTWLFLAGEKV